MEHGSGQGVTSLWPLSTCTHCPVWGFHTRAVLSADALARCRPPLENFTDTTPSVCPAVSAPVGQSLEQSSRRQGRAASSCGRNTFTSLQRGKRAPSSVRFSRYAGFERSAGGALSPPAPEFPASPLAGSPRVFAEEYDVVRVEPLASLVAACAAPGAVPLSVDGIMCTTGRAQRLIGAFTNVVQGLVSVSAGSLAQDVTEHWQSQTPRVVVHTHAGCRPSRRTNSDAGSAALLAFFLSQSAI